MSRYYDRDWDDEYGRGRPQRRDHSPDYPPRAYDNGPYPSGTPSRHPYDDRYALPQQEPGGLHVPPSNHRPRSLPPQQALVARPPSHYARSASRSPPRHVDDYDYDRHRDRDWDRDHSRRRSPSPRGPIGQVRSAVDKTFSHSSSGLGVSLLGAVVGGIAAREMSSAALRTRSKKELNDAINSSGPGPYRDSRDGGPVYNPPHPRARRGSSAGKEEADKSRLVSTVVGAIVGGLGANALERRFESSRKSTRAEQAAWERKWGHGSDYGDHDYDRRGVGDGRGRAVGRRDDYGDEDDRYYEDSRRRPRRSGSEDGHYRW